MQILINGPFNDCSEELWAMLQEMYLSEAEAFVQEWFGLSLYVEDDAGNLLDPKAYVAQAWKQALQKQGNTRERPTTPDRKRAVKGSNRRSAKGHRKTRKAR